MLNDSDYYHKIPHQREHETLQKVKDFATKYLEAEELTDKEADFLTEFEVKSSNFYGLPKVHKSKLVLDAVRQQIKGLNMF